MDREKTAMDLEKTGTDPEKTGVDLEARDSLGRRVYDENGEKIHWASRRDRVVAFILALVVVAITIAFAYSLATGDLIRR